MAKETNIINQGGGGAVFFTAWIGALIYFVNQANGFWEIILAFLKSIVWPAYVIYHGLQALGA